MKKHMTIPKAIVVLGLAWLSASASATTYTWNSSNSGNWSDTSASGWNAAAYPSVADDVAIFRRTLTSNTTVTVDAADARMGQLLLSGSATAGGWALAGANPLTFDAVTGVAVITSAVGTNVISAPISLATNLTVAVTNTSLTLSGPISGIGSIQKTGAATLTISGSNAFSGGMVMNAGTLYLSGSNTFSGGVSLNAGTLYIMNNYTLGSGTFTINGGSVNVAASRTLTNLSGIVLNGNFGHPGWSSTTYDLNFGISPVNLASNVTVAPQYGPANNSGGLIFFGNISGVGSLTVNRTNAYAGYVALYGSNTFSGGLTLQSAYLRINNNYALGTGPMWFKGGTFVPPNSTVIANTNTLYLASLTLLSDVGVSVNFGAGPLVLITNATITPLSANTVTINRPISDGGNNFRLITSGWDAYADVNLSLNGTNTFGGGIDFNPGGGTSGNGNYNFNLNIGCLGTDATASALGTGPLRILPSSGSTYKLKPVIDNTSGADGTLATGNAQVWSNNFTFRGTKSLNMGTGAVALGTNVTVTVSANTFTIGGPIGDGNRSFALTKAGAGTFLVTSANTYGGGTTINTGRLSVAGGTLGTGSVHVVNGGRLDLQTDGVIGDKATVQLDNVGASFGVVSLSNGVVDTISALVLGGTTNTQPGTYGATNSAAQNRFANYFAGPGMLRIAGTPGTSIVVR